MIAILLGLIIALAGVLMWAWMRIARIERDMARMRKRINSMDLDLDVCA